MNAEASTELFSGPVFAKNCLWFAWADPELNGPEEELEIGNNGYKPIPIDVERAALIRIEATNPADQWEHHPGISSNAGGIDDVRGLENPLYKDAKYNSENIVPLEARLNLLVAMLGNASPPMSDVPQIPIGLEPVQLTVGANTRLFLGFHDGHEWKNNSGQVDVKVSLLAAAE